MKRLLDVNPKPLEWYIVSPNEKGKTRTVVLVTESPNRAYLPYMGATGVGNLFDPVKITKDEAREQLLKEMEEHSLVIKDNSISKSDRRLAQTFFENTRRFLKKHFGEYPPHTIETILVI